MKPEEQTAAKAATLTTRMERLLVRATLESLLRAGFNLRIEHDPDLGFSIDRGKLFDSAISVDDCRIVAYRPKIILADGSAVDGDRVGWVRFVFGNDGWDALADNALSLEPYLEGVNELADRLAERAYSN